MTPHFSHLPQGVARVTAEETPNPELVDVDLSKELGLEDSRGRSTTSCDLSCSTKTLMIKKEIGYEEDNLQPLTITKTMTIFYL